MSDAPETDIERTLKPALDVFTKLASTLKQERDELKMQLKVMHAERDVARISARKSDEAHDRVIGDLERADVMAEKAKELIARWDQPSWKDTAPTAGFINALRNAVEAYEKKPND
jgi:hypothetical protein